MRASDIKTEERETSVKDALKEQQDLVLAMALAWLRVRRDHWQAEYKVLAVEPEILTVLYENMHYKVLLQSRPDVIAERLSDGALIQWELKSVKMITSNWIAGWEHNMQLVGQQLAVMQWARDNGRSHDSVGGAVVEAILKGRREKGPDGYRHQTNLIYAYTKSGDGLLVPDQLSATWKRDWKKTLVSKCRPLEEWIWSLPLEDVVSKVVVVPPLKPSQWEIDQAAEQWGLQVINNYECARTIYYENEQRRRETLMNDLWPQNTEHCWRMGKCQYYDLCWSPAAAADPLGSGFKMREPNHPAVEEES